MRLAANCCNVVKQDEFFKAVTFRDCPGTELENECICSEIFTSVLGYKEKE
jgi:hypothetical protein